MQLFCATLSAVVLFLSGAFVALCAAGPYKPKRDGEQTPPPAAPSAFENDLRALLGYTPDAREEENDHEI